MHDAGGERAEARQCIYSSKTPQSRKMTLNGDCGLGILNELSVWGRTQKAEGFKLWEP